MGKWRSIAQSCTPLGMKRERRCRMYSWVRQDYAGESESNQRKREQPKSTPCSVTVQAFHHQKTTPHVTLFLLHHQHQSSRESFPLVFFTRFFAFL
ncbi:hypothetical protein L484_010494 [Morus notabilis]|uniref:Uncharacterized protein n=1 Tax=Morus notabilis TaxID=981085 RepID=W9QZW2_9ROSA|nr:hypothetical protein L484_010494 [Morus notabilis]